MLNPTVPPSRPAGAGLFDLFLLLLRNLPLLVIVPLLAGALAYGLSWLLPRTYASAAIVALPQNYPKMTPQQVASMMTSPVVLDPVMEAMGLTKQFNRDQARAELARRVKAGVPKDLLVRLEVQGGTPEEAQQTAVAILDSWLKSTVPSEREKADLQRRLEVATAGFQNTQKALTDVLQDNPASVGRRERGVSLVAIGELSDRYLDQTLLIPREMEGIPREVIRQQPTLPAQPIKPRKLTLAATAAFLAFLATLAALVARYFLDLARADPLSAEKLRLLRESLPGRARAQERTHA